MDRAKFKRKRLFIDPQIQGSLMRHIIAYWLVCMTTLFVVLWWWSVFMLPDRPILSHMDQVWPIFGPVLITSLLIVPLILIDTLRLSNRFTGPMLRIRQAMRLLSEDRDVHPIHFRDNDFWSGFADDFNQMLARVESDRRALVIELDQELAKNVELALAITSKQTQECSEESTQSELQYSSELPCVEGDQEEVVQTH